MAPTVQRPGGGQSRKHRSSRHQDGDDKKTDLICRVKYSNTLPDIPFDPKFLAYPFDTQRFISYNPTGLERNYKYELLTEHDLGVTIDLINPDVYQIREDVMLHPEDEKLLEEDNPGVSNTKRSAQHGIALSWMRRPDYISTEQTRYEDFRRNLLFSIYIFYNSGINQPPLRRWRLILATLSGRK